MVYLPIISYTIDPILSDHEQCHIIKSVQQAASGTIARPQPLLCEQKKFGMKQDGGGGVVEKEMQVGIYKGTRIWKLFLHNKAWGRDLRQVARLVKVVQWDVAVSITFCNAVFLTDYSQFLLEPSLLKKSSK
uniref:Uncharacterized protein n=1 Tax=Timema monikensis TaxID=170555 RepID=A0A7R9E2G2_9NEOP|nr:unnamed protein product [Timema monikensis]